MLPGWTAVVVNYNGAGFIEACLSALSRCNPRPRDVVVVDNASTDDSVQELHVFPRVNLLGQARNLGFAGGANAGLVAVETELALLLNPDVEVAPDIGGAMLTAFANDHRLGAAGTLLCFPESDTIQHAGGVVERPLMTTRHLGYGESQGSVSDASRDVDYVTGAAMALRLEAWEAVGGFDTRFSPVYYEEVDLCVRLRAAGWHVRLVPSMRGSHHEGATLERGSEFYRHMHRNRIRFALKHLSGAEWREQFVPAEYARLRHELWTVSGDDWVDRSGAGAIEALLSDAGWMSDAGHRLMGPAPSSLEPSVHDALAGWDLPPFAARKWWQFPSPMRQQLNEVIAQQRDWNAAVTRALEIQDKLNREQTASLLLLGLDLLGRLPVSAEGTAAPRADSAAE